MNIPVQSSEASSAGSLVRDPSYPSPRELVHFSLFSGKNFAEMVRFYQVVLNMRLVYEINGKIHFVALSFDEENHRIGLVELPDLADRPTKAAGVEHTSWRYRSLKEALAAVRHVEQELGLFPHAVHQGTLISLSYKDPDGNRCEMIIECMPSQAEIIDFYVVTLVENPFFNTLMPFDLRGMLRHEDEGTPTADLLSYEWVRDNLPV